MWLICFYCENPVCLKLTNKGKVENGGWGLKRWVKRPSRWSNFLLPVDIVLTIGDFKMLPKMQCSQTSEQCRQRCAHLCSHHACRLFLKVNTSGEKNPKPSLLSVNCFLKDVGILYSTLRLISPFLDKCQGK